MNEKERIIIALDFENFQDAKQMIDTLDDAVFFKVGLQAFLQFGQQILKYLKDQKKKIFLDLKFKDIPNTVYGAVKSSIQYFPDFLTIHVSGGGEMIRRAMAAAETTRSLTLLGVTVLTSLSDEDLKDTGISLSTKEAVIKLCQLGIENNLKSFVCSPLEITPLRRKFGDQLVLVTPGIRPSWAAKGDQKRVFTPKMAIDSGSNYLVIGRPITAASNPSEAFERILSEIKT